MNHRPDPGRFDAPWVDVRTGYSCNNRCRFCDQGGPRARPGDAPLQDVIDSLFRHLPAGGVWLAGGEVTLRPDLPDLVRAVRALGVPRVGIQTNGRILSAAGAARSLVAAGLTDAAVALHGPGPEVHDWLVGDAGAFRQAALGARRLVEAGTVLRIQCVVTRSNHDHLPEVARLAAALRATALRFIACRPVGAAADADRSLVPRFSLVRAPLLSALGEAAAGGVAGETAGIPLCFLPGHPLAAVDRADLPLLVRVFPGRLAPEDDERAPETRRVHAPPCEGCRLRPACRGVDRGYLERHGWDELEPVDAAPAPPAAGRVLLPVQAPCSLRCAGCLARVAFGAAWVEEPPRTLRQRLVRASALGSSSLAFAGASPWSHPDLPQCIWEAARLGFQRVEVWGPAHPLADVDDVLLSKAAPLARARVPRFGPDPAAHDAACLTPGAWDATTRGLARLREVAPACEIDWYDADPPAPTGAPLGPAAPGRRLFGALGPLAVWAGCEPGIQEEDRGSRQ